MTKEQFLAITGNWDNHRNLLWPALEATKHLKLPILELGCGMGSTEYLRQYCQDEQLKFLTYDSNKEWADKYASTYIENWDTLAWRKQYAVALVDNAPGEFRKIAIPRLENTQILICHDTEPAADYGYQMRAELAKFKYMIDWESEGAWASAVSNIINVRAWSL